MRDDSDATDVFLCVICIIMVVDTTIDFYFLHHISLGTHNKRLKQRVSFLRFAKLLLTYNFHVVDRSEIGWKYNKNSL